MAARLCRTAPFVYGSQIDLMNIKFSFPKPGFSNLELGHAGVAPVFHTLETCVGYINLTKLTKKTSKHNCFQLQVDNLRSVVTRVGFFYKHMAKISKISKAHLGATKHTLIGLRVTPWLGQNVQSDSWNMMKTPKCLTCFPAMNSESKEIFTHMRLRKGGRSLEVSLFLSLSDTKGNNLRSLNESKVNRRNIRNIFELMSGHNYDTIVDWNACSIQKMFQKSMSWVNWVTTKPLCLGTYTPSHHDRKSLGKYYCEK